MISYKSPIAGRKMLLQEMCDSTTIESETFLQTMYFANHMIKKIEQDVNHATYQNKFAAFQKVYRFIFSIHYTRNVLNASIF